MKKKDTGRDGKGDMLYRDGPIQDEWWLSSFKPKFKIRLHNNSF